MINSVLTKPADSGRVGNGQPNLPRRDWILLPLTGFVVICLIAGSIEFISSKILTKNDKDGEDCLVGLASATGPRGIANCVCVEKKLESQPVEYRFNSNGFRNDKNFGPKPPGVYRITIIGTSVAAGFRVSEEKTFGVLLTTELSHRTGRTIETYNEGIPGRSPQMIAHSFDRDVLGTNPDLVLWIMSPSDLSRSDWLIRAESTRGLGMWAKLRHYIAFVSDGRSLAASAIELFGHTGTARLLQVLLYRSATLYVKSSYVKLSQHDDVNGLSYLKSTPPAQLLQNLHDFDLSAGEIEREAKTAGIPVVVVWIPDRMQSSMVSANSWSPGTDPYHLTNSLNSIVASHGWPFINALTHYQSIPNSQLGYFALDGHLNAAGHATIAEILTKDLTAGAVPALKAAPQD